MTQCVIDAKFMTLEVYSNAELGPVIDRNKDSMCIAMWVFHIAIRFLAYHCTPTRYDPYMCKLQGCFLQIRVENWDVCMTIFFPVTRKVYLWSISSIPNQILNI